MKKALWISAMSLVVLVTLGVVSGVWAAEEHGASLQAIEGSAVFFAVCWESCPGFLLPFPSR